MIAKPSLQLILIDLGMIKRAIQTYYDREGVWQSDEESAAPGKITKGICGSRSSKYKRGV